MKQVIAIALLVAVATAASKFQDTHSVLAQMETSEFGKTVLSLVHMNMKVGNPIEEINLVMDQITSQIGKKQDQADKTNLTEQASCENDISTYSKNIADTKRKIESLELLIKQSEEIRTQAIADLAQAKMDFEEVTGRIDAGTKQRKDEHDAWAEKDYELSVDITTVEEGIRLVQHMLHGVAFAQVETKYNKVIEKLQTKGTRQVLFKPLVSQLVQITTKFNYENVVKVLDLLNNIRLGLVNEQTEARNQEQKAQADWEALLATLIAHKQALSEKILQKETTIDNETKNLKSNNESLKNNKFNLENYEQSLAETIETCNEKSALYIAETAEREKQLEIMGQLQTHVNEKLRPVADYLDSRQF